MPPGLGNDIAPTICLPFIFLLSSSLSSRKLRFFKKSYSFPFLHTITTNFLSSESVKPASKTHRKMLRVMEACGPKRLLNSELRKHGKFHVPTCLWNGKAKVGNKKAISMVLKNLDKVNFKHPPCLMEKSSGLHRSMKDQVVWILRLTSDFQFLLLLPWMGLGIAWLTLCHTAVTPTRRGAFP